jgi:hypothetical protein
MLLDMTQIVDTYPLITVSHQRESVALRRAIIPYVLRGPELCDGQGMTFTVPVDDASILHARLSTEDAPFHYGLTDCPWGQRRFMLHDPPGAVVEVVE